MENIVTTEEGVIMALPWRRVRNNAVVIKQSAGWRHVRQHVSRKWGIAMAVMLQNIKLAMVVMVNTGNGSLRGEGISTHTPDNTKH